MKGTRSQRFKKQQPLRSVADLRRRLERFIVNDGVRERNRNQLNLEQEEWVKPKRLEIAQPTATVKDFLDFLIGALPDGGVYLFGGVLRDFALFGRSGFASDIDMVVEGSWSHCVRYLDSLGAEKNKFGGYRIKVGGWPLDIWNAEETWAIRKGYVQYKGISSLTETVVLNWDAILMDWRNRRFIYRPRYFEDINARILDIVLEDNPNPLGMAVRVFRHLVAKDARKITHKAAEYLAKCAKKYPFKTIRSAEVQSFGDSIISRPIFALFAELDATDRDRLEDEFSIASKIVERQLFI